MNKWISMIKNKKRRTIYNNDCNEHRTLNNRYGIGAKLLAKMGYKEGDGLGRDGSGVTAPIEVLQRAHGIGIGGLISEGSESNNDSDSDSLVDELTEKVSFNSSGVLTSNYRIIDKLNRVKDLELYVPDDMKSCIIRMGNIPSQKALEIDKYLSGLIDIGSKVEKLDMRKDEILKRLKEEYIISNDYKVVLSAVKDANSSFMDKLNAILIIDDSEIVDKLCAKCIIEYYHSQREWDPLDILDPFYVNLIEAVEVLEFSMDSTSHQLNRTQTVIFDIIWHKLSHNWESITKENLRNLIGIILDYQEILSFINCLNYIYEKYVYKIILDWLEQWKMGEHLTNADSILDLIEILPTNIVFNLKDAVEKKFTSYCVNWYHRDSPLDDDDFKFTKSILGSEVFNQISTRAFLPNFFNQLWHKYFDPTLELEDNSCKDGSLYFIYKFRSCKSIFDDESYQIILDAIFNDINKVIFQWNLYRNDTFTTEAKPWLEWYFNKAFFHPNNEEYNHMEISKKLLHTPERGIHDETLDLELLLGLKTIEKETVENIPMRKVSATFRDVVQDYCEAHDLILSKSNDECTTLVIYGRKVSVPIFKVKSSASTLSVAIKDDVLWVRKNNEFVPIFLYMLSKSV